MANIIESRVTLEDEVFEETIDTMEEPIEVVRPSSYEDLEDLPQVNGVTLMGNKTSEELGIVTATDIENAVSAEATLRENADTALGGRIDGEKTSRENADTALGGRIDTEITNRTEADRALGTRIDNEILARQGGDNNLQTQIDAITSKSDVVDVVADYAALQAYDTQHLGNNDVIKVLDDETHNDAQTYYRWNKTAGTWSYIGSEAPYYSKGQIDQQMLGKQDKLTAGTGITLDGSTISADTTVLATKEDLEPEIVADLPTVGDATKLYLTPTNKTASGNPITIDLKEDVGQMTSFQLDGDTFQESYTGKNLLNIDATPGQVVGVTYEVNGQDLKITDTNDSGNYHYVQYRFSNLTPGEKYTASFQSVTASSGSPTGRIIFATYGTGDNPNSNIGGVEYPSNSYTFTVPSDAASIGISFYARGGSGSIYTYSQIMLEKSSTATSFEPYVGGIPAPSPDYPQAIQTVTGEQTVEIVGINILSSTWEDGGLDGATGGEAPYSNAVRTADFVKVEPSETYILSRGGAGVAMNVFRYGSDKSFLYSSTISAGNVFTTSAQTQYVKFFRSSTGGTEQMQLQKGSTITPYTPYSKQTLPINLGSIELCKLGTYQDYIYKDGENWKVHKAIGSNTFDGTETWSQSGDTTTTVYTALTNLINAGLRYAFVDSDLSKMDRFHFINGVATPEIGAFKMVTNASGVAQHLRLMFDITTISTVDSAKAWIAANKPKLYSILYAPTDTVITDTILIAQLEAVKKATLANGQNTVTNTATGENLAGSMSIGYYGYNPSEYSEWLYVDGAWEQVGGQPIPTKTSDILNDSGFIDESGIALKLQNEVVSELPENGDEGKLYLTPKDFYIQSSSGNPTSINIDNRAGAIDGVTISGNTTQTTYTGKNLFNKNTATLGKRVGQYGNPYDSEDGFASDFIPVQPSTQYTANYVINSYLYRIAYYNSSKAFVSKNENSSTFTTPSDCAYIRICGDLTQLNSDMIVLGSSAGDYEPYVGGMPSPNPNYPQSIRSISGEHTINIDSVNLFDKSQVTEGYYLNSTGEEVSNVQWSYSDYIPVIPGQSYTVSGFLVNANAPKECFYDENKNFVSSISHVTGNTTIVIPSGCYYIRLNLFYRPTGDDPKDELNICQFQKGTTATTYTEYYKKSFTINLGSLYLRKIGTYADQIYYDNGWKIKTAIGMKTLKGVAPTIDRTGANVFRFTNILNNSIDKARIGSGQSSHFGYNPVQVNVTGTLAFGEFAIQDGNHLFFKINSSIDTVDACRAWFAEHNTIVIYPLQNQRTEDITDQTLIAQLDAIRAEILGMGGYTVKIDTAGSFGAQYHSYNPNDLYDEWLYIDGRYEKIPLSPVDGGYEFINSADANNRLWKIWNARLAYGMDTATAAVPSYFNSSVVSNGMVIAHNTGDRTSNRWGLHLFEGYSKDNYGRLTMLLDKFTENDKKSCAIYYFDGANEHASSYDNVKLGSDCVGHSFNFDRDEMTAYGAVFCNMPLTLARIDPSTDLNRTYETVEEVDAAYHPEGSMVNNVKCLKYIYLKNAPDGTMWYDTARNKIVVKINGEWHDMNTTAVPEGTYDF